MMSSTGQRCGPNGIRMGDGNPVQPTPQPEGGHAMSTKTLDELARETARGERERERRIAVNAEHDERTVRPTMTRGEARSAAIALMLIGAHENDGENDELHRAYLALARAGGIRRSR